MASYSNHFFSEAERSNFRDIMHYISDICLENSRNDEAFQLLYDFWETKISRPLWELGFYSDYLQCGNIVLQVAKICGHTNVEAQLLGEMGYCYMERGKLEKAEPYLSDALKKYELSNNLSCQCKILRYLATLLYRQDKFEVALEYCQRAQGILGEGPTEAFDTFNWNFNKAALQNLMGSINLELNNLSESYHQFRSALNIARTLTKHKDYYQLASLRNLGRWYFLNREYEQAQKYYQECLEKSQSINRLDMMARIKLDLAELAAIQGRKYEAIKLADESASIAHYHHPVIREQAARFKEANLSLSEFDVSTQTLGNPVNSQ